MRFYLFLSTLFIYSTLISQVNLTLEPWGSGFSSPIGITNAGDDRLFVNERSGYVRIIDGQGNVLATPFLDIDSKVVATGGQSERGLLGLAFHPDYDSNGFFYVHYIRNDGNSQFSRFSVKADDPNQADSESELPMLTLTQPYGNHNGGDLKFGPDGYLYFGMGDGGSFNDPGNRSQNPQVLLGKMLRIDVDNGLPYTIPDDNPFVNDAGVLDEIWALGLRNPWRFSFDSYTGDMWIGDVGQDQFAEIDMEPAGGSGGRNYGWRCYEAFEPYLTSGCADPSEFTPPIYSYAHGGGAGPCSITGGFVYRGIEFVDLYEKYIYADYCSGNIWALSPDGNNGWTNESLTQVSGGAWTSFGEGSNGAIYVCGLNNGFVYKLTTDELASPPAITLSNTLLEIIPGDFTPYTAYQWYLDDQPISGAINETFDVTIEGDYYVEVTTFLGQKMISNTLNYMISDVAEIPEEWSFEVFPNPFSNYFTVNITSQESKKMELHLYSLDGKKLKTWTKANTNVWEEDLNLKYLTPGVYQLELVIDERTSKKRIVKQ